MLTEDQYNAAMQRIEHYCRKDLAMLNEEEQADFDTLCDQCAEFEGVHYPMPITQDDVDRAAIMMLKELPNA